jgi:hypothetical protein
MLRGKMAKISSKKIYCPACSKLVRTKEQKGDPGILKICTQCGRQLYSWNGIIWKPTAKPLIKELS